MVRANCAQVQKRVNECGLHQSAVRLKSVGWKKESITCRLIVVVHEKLTVKIMRMEREWMGECPAAGDPKVESDPSAIGISSVIRFMQSGEPLWHK